MKCFSHFCDAQTQFKFNRTLQLIVLSNCRGEKLLRMKIKQNWKGWTWKIWRVHFSKKGKNHDLRDSIKAGAFKFICIHYMPLRKVVEFTQEFAWTINHSKAFLAFLINGNLFLLKGLMLSHGFQGNFCFISPL